MGILNVFTKVSESRELIKQGKILINNRNFNEAINALSKVLGIKPNNYDALIARARAYCYVEEYNKALIDLNRSIDVNALCSLGHFYKGQVNIINENLYEAIEDFNRVLRIDKRNFLAYLKRGSIYSKLGIYDAAVSNFKALVRIKKRDSRYYDLLLSACLAAKKYDEVEKYATRLIKLHDENPRGYYYLGRMYASKNKNSEAVSYFSDALKRGGNNLDFRYHRGMCYVYLGEFEDAIVDFTLGIGMLNEHGGEFYFSRGYCYLKLNEFEKAIEDYNKSIELNYNTKSCYYNKATSYIKLKDYTSAITILSKLLEEEDNFEGAYYDRAFCYKNINEYSKAISDYLKAIELNPKVESFYYELARVYFETNDFDNVISILDSAEKNIEKWSYKTFTYTLKGDIYFNEKKDMMLAAKYYTKSIRVSPTAYAHIQRGKVYIENKKYSEALEDFNRSLEIEPENNNALYYKGYINYINNDINKALIYLNSSIGFEKSIDAMLLRGKCLIKSKRLSEGISDFTSVIELDHNNPEAYISRADALKNLNMYDDAIKDYKKASLINKEYISESYYNIGSILSLKGKSKQAIYYYSKSIENGAPNYEVYLKRSEELSKIGEYNDAVNDIENAVEKLNKEDGNYRGNKDSIVKILVDISKKTITEQLLGKIIVLLGFLEKQN